MPFFLALAPLFAAISANAPALIGIAGIAVTGAQMGVTIKTTKEGIDNSKETEWNRLAIQRADHASKLVAISNQ